MLNDLPVHDLAMSVEQAEGSILIGAHQASVTRHVGAEDRGETTFGH